MMPALASPVASRPSAGAAARSATMRCTARATRDALDLETLPGHLVRRMQQIAVAIFLQETEASGITPVQFAALQAVAD